MGKTTISPLRSKTPTVISRPSSAASIKISSSSLNASSMAAFKSAASVTLYTPKLLPARFAFTKQGSPTVLMISSSSILSPKFNARRLAEGMPRLLATARQLRLS